MEVGDELPMQCAIKDKVDFVKVDKLKLTATSENCQNGSGSQSSDVGDATSTALEKAALSDTDTPLEVHVSSDNNIVNTSTMQSLSSKSLDAEVVEATDSVQNSVLENNNSSTELKGTTTNNTEFAMLESQELPIEQSEIASAGTGSDNVTFKTEVVVEQANSETVLIQEQLDTTIHDNENTNNILTELGQTIELSEVLRSDTENVDNNNSGRQEMFNKEELLDILEGNDIATSAEEMTNLLQTDDHETKKILESQIALKQLSRLKNTRNKNSGKSRVENQSAKKKKRPKQVTTDSGIENKNKNSNLDEVVKEVCDVTEKAHVPEKVHIPKKNKVPENIESDSIVNVLVKDWDDDEPVETEQSNKSIEKSEMLVNSSEEFVKSEVEVPASQNDEKPTDINKNDGSQPQRRFGRVIKKKVIFDPDNPDTFTKSKAITKHKESNAENNIECPTKKTKLEEKQRSKSKSPMSKMTWKKPPPKINNKQNKRLTEVDKLLMDEGAVNMIYQLTPEAPKGKKNMRTKAEFIKKLQSSTPKGNEMKFRERKKERTEEEAKKILSGKQRSSLSGSVKSLSVCEDFETHSADDSIIYRRHSSSSYSSTCMSPRRLSDVDMSTCGSQSTINTSQGSQTNGDQVADIFMGASADTSATQIINKNDCLSIKEKLNNKLSQALNKRRRENSKGDKLPKQTKKIIEPALKSQDIKLEKSNTFKHVAVKYQNTVAEAIIRKTEHGGSVELIKELIHVLKEFDSSKITNVTLLTSESGSLFSDLYLHPMLDENMEKRTNYAYELAETIRLLLCTVEQHSKLLICGVWSTCTGVALPLLALSDVALASEDSTFAFSDIFPKPGVAVFTARSQLSQILLNDLVVFGRRISATEALNGGLVSRVLWPRRVDSQVRAIANDIASQPKQSILLKKKLLNLKKSKESEAIFLSSLEKERDMLVQYWTSVEGQEILRRDCNVS